MGMLGADPGVVQTGRYRTCLEDLTVLVLQEPGPHPVNDTGDSVAHRGTSRRLDAHEPRTGVDESRERAGRVRATSDTGHHDIGIETE